MQVKSIYNNKIMLSQSCKAAIKAVVYLSLKFHTKEKSVIREIAEEINVSEHTVGKLLQSLAKQGVINSVKGPAGGFFLSESQMNQPLMNIIQTIDGKHVFSECGLGLSKCSEKHPCPIHDKYKLARDILENIFTAGSVADLSSPVNRGLAFLAG
jgi:Rrf2 family protein